MDDGEDVFAPGEAKMVEMTEEEIQEEEARQAKQAQIEQEMREKEMAKAKTEQEEKPNLAEPQVLCDCIWCYDLERSAELVSGVALSIAHCERISNKLSISDHYLVAS